jgi:hypothetical protein
MTTISGFTFIHNAISSGYPYVDEMVVVDMQSTDGTRGQMAKAKTEGYRLT